MYEIKMSGCLLSALLHECQGDNDNSSYGILSGCQQTASNVEISDSVDSTATLKHTICISSYISTRGCRPDATTAVGMNADSIVGLFIVRRDGILSLSFRDMQAVLAVQARIDILNRSFTPVTLHIPSLSRDSAAEYEAVGSITNGPQVEDGLHSLNMKDQLASAIISSVKHDMCAVSILDDIKEELRVISALERQMLS